MNQEILPYSLVFFAFLLGSIPFGIFVARFYGVENLKSVGSGNIGATNVTRVAGFWPAGFLTLLLDVAKGLVLLLPLKLGVLGFENLHPSAELLWSVGLMAVIGHCFSPWLRFRGGKGVATSFGVLFVLAPWSGVFGALGFLTAFFATRVGAVSSLTGLLLAGAVHLIFYPWGLYIAPMAAMILLVVYRHESNLSALLEKRESVF